MMKKLMFIVLSMVMCLGIYAQDIPNYPLDTIDGKIYYRYRVARSIGLYRISKNFGVSQEEILDANPQVQRDGLRYDEEILIPVKEAKKPTPNISQTGKDLSEEAKGERLEARSRVIRSPKSRGILRREPIAVDSTIVDSTQIDTTVVDSGEVIRIAALLPLYADAIERDKGMDRFYDYYTGMLIAVNEVQQAGQRIELFTHDIGKTAQKVSTLVSDSNWQKMDAIVGPAFSQQVAAVQDVAKRDSSLLLIPFLSHVGGIEEHPYMLKFNPSAEVVADTMGRYLAQYGDSVNCVVFEAVGDGLPSSISQLHKALKRYHIPTTTATLRAILTDSLDGIFVEGKENIIIFNTEKYGNLQTVMPHLLQACGQYRITLYAQYSWQTEKIILPQIYTTVFMADPVIPAAYDSVYNKYFAHSLSSSQPRYDLLGYDQTRQLLHILQTPKDSINIWQWQGLQSTIEYVPVVAGGGYENQHIQIIRK